MRSWPIVLQMSWLLLRRAEVVCGTAETGSTRWVFLAVQTWVLRLAADDLIPFGFSLCFWVEGFIHGL